MTTHDFATRIHEVEAQLAELARTRADSGEGPLLKALLEDMAKRRAIEQELRRAQE